jgi:hypothetical protein
MEYFLAIKNEMSFSEEWMELEIIMLSVINQNGKEKYHVLSLTSRTQIKKLHECKWGLSGEGN